MKQVAATCIGVLLISVSAMAQDPGFQPKEWSGDSIMSLKAGTMQLGGTLGVNIDVAMPDEGDSQTGFTFDLSPSFGYFVANGFMLEGAFSLQIRGGDLYKNAGMPLAFVLGGRYFITGGTSVIPYIGARIGMSVYLPDEGDAIKSLLIMVPLGILWPLNQWVAVDLGASLNVLMSLEEGGGTTMTIPIGYLGIESFF